MGKLDRDHVTLVIIFGILAVLMTGVFYAGYRQSLITYESESAFHECYRVIAPFGVFWVETEGHFFLASGSLSSDMKEEYVVKYLVETSSDLEVRSKTLDAETTPVVVDGTFRFEIIKKIEVYPDGYRRRIYSQNGKQQTKYKIHIPYLPEVNQLLTEEWVILDN